MKMRIRITRIFASLLVFALAFTFNLASRAEAQTSGRRARITERIDNSKRITVHGNTLPYVNTEDDLGPADDSTDMGIMQLLLQPSPDQQAALDQFTSDVNDPSSSSFHQYITMEQFASLYGASQSDIDTASAWLTSQGFTVIGVGPNNLIINFTGTAGQVAQAFGTRIHRLTVNGERHLANANDPSIPAALAPVVKGVVSLNDFRPHRMAVQKAGLNAQHSDFSTSSGFELVAPQDLATIYNENPLFSAGVTGAGQNIVLIEDTDVYNFPGDWNTFRRKFGLTKYSAATFNQVHPGGSNTCTPPGTNGDDGEAAIDVEWATAAAPSANIVLVACASSGSTFGGLLALQNYLATNPKQTVVSISYGESEPLNGATRNAAYNATYQNAVAEGVAIFVSSGDEGAASTDANRTAATHGITVSGFTSTPFNVSVGGTDFGDTYAGVNSTYWNTNNSIFYGSAKSYVPEIPWNDSCAGILLATYESVHFGRGSGTQSGPNSFCQWLSVNAPRNGLITTASGSGGPSGCATGAPANSGVANGTCAGYPKPSFQQGLLGVPADGVRDIPDVSLFAANGLWNHYYPVCWSDPAEGGVSCAGTPDTWAGFGGTSISSPIWAGFQALVNQMTSTTWGNPNKVYYQLAENEYGATGNPSCNSSLGNGVASNCVFYDVTLGDMVVDCLPLSSSLTFNCYFGGVAQNNSSNHYGALSTSNSIFGPAYGTQTGWDFATGIGTVNVQQLVNQWNSGVVPPTM